MSQRLVFITAPLSVVLIGCAHTHDVPNDEQSFGVPSSCSISNERTVEVSDTSAAGFSASQVVTSLGTSEWSVAWDASSHQPAFSTLLTAFAIGDGQVRVWEQDHADSAVPTCDPIGTVMSVPVEVTIESGDEAFRASGTGRVLAAGLLAEDIRLNDGAMPSVVATAVPEELASWAEAEVDGEVDDVLAYLDETLAEPKVYIVAVGTREGAAVDTVVASGSLSP